MKAAYIGILTPGTTSRMRAEVLKALTPDWNWTWIDTHPPYLSASRWAKTLSFRFKIGPVISRINQLVQSELSVTHDLIWLDKAANLSLETTKHLRQLAGVFIHYTPDTAFYTNRSKSFNSSLEHYDWAITTKTFEAKDYAQWMPTEKLIFTTQGYDRDLHYPRNSIKEKRAEVVFIGLCEPDREACMDALLEAGVPVRVAGINWENFGRRHAGNPNFHYLGKTVFGDDYAKLISSSWVSIGLLSKRFPELHTTRTFEIPACGTILATESNAETQSFFNPNEALFYKDYTSLATQLKMLLNDECKLTALGQSGHKRVKQDQRDYHSILESLLTQTGFSTSGEP